MNKQGLQFYMDESGNTGGNLLNKEQPFFVTGGWLMNDSYIKKLNQYVSTLDFESEIHYKKLPMGLAKESLGIMVKMIIDSMSLFNNPEEDDFVLPIFVRMRKDYLLIDRLIYSIFDSQFGPKEYKEYIDSSFLLNDEKLLEFVHIVKSKLGENRTFLKSAEKLFNFSGDCDPIYNDYLDNCINEFLQVSPYSENPMYVGFLKHINKNDVFDDLNSNGSSRYQREVVPLVISTLFDSIENILNLNIGLDKIIIYPDSDSNKNYIDDYWKMLNEVFLDKKSNEKGGYKNISKIEPNCLSEDYLGIQLADVLCSMQNELLRDGSSLSTKHLKKGSNKIEKNQNEYREILNELNELLLFMNQEIYKKFGISLIIEF